MTKFEVLKNIDEIEEFVDLIVGFVEEFKTPDRIVKELKHELIKEELQTIKNAAQNGYPLSFSDKQ